MSNSTLTLTAGEDGIQAETSAVVSAGTYAITSGGGSTVTPGDDVSAKGIKTGTDLTLSSGIYTLDCSDDAIHANGNVTITGGSYTISTGDDAAHADGDLTVSGGTLDIQASYEGLEGGTVTVSGGDITAVSSDDALNAAGGNDGSGFGGHGMGNTFTPGGNSSAITITDGTIQMLAGGDGLDSNGSIEMTGGTVVVCSTGGGDGALDYESSFTLDGGILFAASAGNMAANPSSPNQPALSVGFGQTLEASSRATHTILCSYSPARPAAPCSAPRNWKAAPSAQCPMAGPIPVRARAASAPAAATPAARCWQSSRWKPA